MTTPAYTAETAPPCLIVGIPGRPPHAGASQLHRTVAYSLNC